ncbi:MAG: hypothetical protein QOF71_3000 [Candidatus Eremiobacteraeota bacterium]|jgi:hypothetical protein|nr:hypothetical protein [Candidatus Eremiobacteraeota bacterium]
MKSIPLRLLAIAVAIVFAALPAQAADLGTLDGTWQGTLAVVPVPNSPGPTHTYTIRIVIAGVNASVFTQSVSDGPFRAVKPGLFRVARLGPNGVVLAMEQGQDNEGTWVETWAYVVTLKSPDTLIANFYRVVNNVDLPLSVDHSKFSEAQAGELSRTK